VQVASLCHMRSLGMAVEDADHSEVQHCRLWTSEAPQATREFKMGRAMFDH
jgi:hypothetical protein